MRTLIMPTIVDVVPGANPDAVNDEEDIAYNAHCTELVRSELVREREAGHEPPTLRTHYPFDAMDGSTDDTVSLNRDGDVVIIDAGAA